MAAHHDSRAAKDPDEISVDTVGGYSCYRRSALRRRRKALSMSFRRSHSFMMASLPFTVSAGSVLPKSALRIFAKNPWQWIIQILIKKPPSGRLSGWTRGGCGG